MMYWRMITRFAPSSRSIIQQKVDAWLATFPVYVTSNGAHKETFTKLTGITQKTLKDDWAGGGYLTSCNAFVGNYSPVVLGSKLRFGLHMFDLKLAMQMAKIPHAWINQADDPTARPEYGDVVRWNRRHVGVSLGFEGPKWRTVEGGKGGPSSGFDAVSRMTYDYYPVSEIMGWVDMAAIYER